MRQGCAEKVYVSMIEGYCRFCFTPEIIYARISIAVDEKILIFSPIDPFFVVLKFLELVCCLRELVFLYLAK